jgi:NitT/TauT family transport system substrate-binding protein
VKARGHILVDERDLWPGGKYVTTLLVVRTEFLKAHPAVVANLIKGVSQSIDLITTDEAKAADDVSKGIEKATSKPLAVDLVTASFKNITYTLDPVASSLRTDVEHAVALGILKETPLTNIFDLAPLNAFLTAEGKPKVAA